MMRLTTVSLPSPSVFITKPPQAFKKVFKLSLLLNKSDNLQQRHLGENSLDFKGFMEDINESAPGMLWRIQGQNR